MLEGILLEPLVLRSRFVMILGTLERYLRRTCESSIFPMSHVPLLGRESALRLNKFGTSLLSVCWINGSMVDALVLVFLYVRMFHLVLDWVKLLGRRMRLCKEAI